MSQILVRNLSPETVERLKEKARRNNRSLEAEVREILDGAAAENVSAEYQKFLRHLESGRDRNTAFLELSRKIRGRQPFDPVGSEEDIRADREERDARLA